MAQSMMPRISSHRVAMRPISLRNGCGRRLRKNIQTIIALTGKEHCFGGKVLYIKHKGVKFKINIIIIIKILILTVTNMQVIITNIWCRIGQSRRIRRNVLVCTSVLEPSMSRGNTNNKIGKGLVTAAVKLNTLWGCVAEVEAELTLDVLLKWPVRRPLPRTSRLSGLPPMTLLPVHGSRGMKTMKSDMCWPLYLLSLERQLPREPLLLWLKLGLCCCWVR